VTQLAPAEFVARRWGRLPAHYRGGAGEFGDLLTLGDVDVIVNTMPLRLPRFAMVRDGRALDPRQFTRPDAGDSSGGPDPLRVSEQLRAGATLILYRLNVWWPPLLRFCHLLELELGHPVTAAAFLTPARSQGLEIHRDDQDVFVLQTEGSKEWSVWDRLPGAPIGRGPVAGHELGEPAVSVVLEPGDCLYVPRGCPHVATGMERMSLHVSVGVHPVTYRDALRAAVGLLADASLDEALPPRFAEAGVDTLPEVGCRLRELVAELGGVDPGRVVGALGEERRRRQDPLLDGHLLDVDRLALVDDATIVRRRPGASMSLTADGPGSPMAEVNHRSFEVARGELAALRRIDRLPAFGIDDLSPDLDATDGRQMVQTLIGLGFLEIVS
jgi:bifunctional lysine-specific demethylase and histidyl-hydroxylase NO66